MVIAEAIRQARILRENEIPADVMVKWLSDHDGVVWEETVSQYEGHQPETRPVYDGDTDKENTELLIQAPWDDLYPGYLAMRIDLAQQDIDRYNNEAAAYEARRQAWAKHYNRTHRWAGTRQYQTFRPRYYDTQIVF